MIAKTGVDFIALSFSRSRRDIETLRKEMAKRKIKAGVVAKIESGEAIDNIDELIDSSDAIMIARGDLGIEIPIEELAYWQKKIVKKCLAARKPVVVATQMLKSMVANSRPTRAEATDVANAVFDGADAVMLSEETSVGNYPEKAVSAMTKILKFNETKAAMFKIKNEPKGFTQLIMNAVMAIIENQSAEKREKISTVVVFTESGYTARVLASFRPKINVIAVTDRKETSSCLNISYGIESVYSRLPLKAFKSYDEVMRKLKEKKMIKRNEIILVAHGRQSEEPGLVNSIILIKVK
jgi:pyruvate kinase